MHLCCSRCSITVPGFTGFNWTVPDGLAALQRWCSGGRISSKARGIFRTLGCDSEKDDGSRPGSEAHKPSGAQSLDQAPLHKALQLLEEPGCTDHQVVEAYQSARTVKNVCLAPSGLACRLTHHVKRILLVIRELLVVLICCSNGSWSCQGAVTEFPVTALSVVGCEIALERAFQHQLTPEIRSQFHLARSACARMGRDQDLFYRHAPKVHDADVTEEELRSVLPMCARVGNAACVWKSLACCGQQQRPRHRIIPGPQFCTQTHRCCDLFSQ